MANRMGRASAEKALREGSWGQPELGVRGGGKGGREAPSLVLLLLHGALLVNGDVRGQRAAGFGVFLPETSHLLLGCGGHGDDAVKRGEGGAQQRQEGRQIREQLTAGTKAGLCNSRCPRSRCSQPNRAEKQQESSVSPSAQQRRGWQWDFLQLPALLRLSNAAAPPRVKAAGSQDVGQNEGMGSQGGK